MYTTMFVLHKSDPNRNFHVTNPSHIPRKGDEVNCFKVLAVNYCFKDCETDMSRLEVTLAVE